MKEKSLKIYMIIKGKYIHIYIFTINNKFIFIICNLKINNAK